MKSHAKVWAGIVSSGCTNSYCRDEVLKSVVQSADLLR